MFSPKGLQSSGCKGASTLINQNRTGRLWYPIYTVSSLAMLGLSIVLYRRYAIALFAAMLLIASINVFLGMLLTQRAYR